MTKEYTIRVTSPVDCTEEHMDEWVQFCTGNRASLSQDNPLSEYDMDAIYCY